MSKFKDLTGGTPPSSSDGSTEAKAPPSLPSAKTEPTETSTPTTKKPLPNTSPNEQSGLTTVATTLTTPPITERVRQHAMLVKVALNILLSAGLIKRYEVRSPDSTTVLRVRYEFDMAQWTEKLELK
jgi:hypothetical protein